MALHSSHQAINDTNQQLSIKQFHIQTIIQSFTENIGLEFGLLFRVYDAYF